MDAYSRLCVCLCMDGCVCVCLLCVDSPSRLVYLFFFVWKRYGQRQQRQSRRTPLLHWLRLLPLPTFCMCSCTNRFSSSVSACLAEPSSCGVMLSSFRSSLRFVSYPSFSSNNSNSSNTLLGRTGLVISLNCAFSLYESAS